MVERFGLYVHIPYCRTHCPYCDFNVRAGRSWPEERYVEALVAELAHHAARPPFAGARLATIFLGGGTPSLFAPSSIGRVLGAARERFDVAPGAEVSLEANPENADVGVLRGYREAGVNRLSFGVQSFDPLLLKRLGRAHTSDQTATCVAAARSAGFDDVSVDLIFAVPGQTLEGFHADLETTIALGPDHVSAYNLTYEEGTPFTALRESGRLVALDDDVEAAMFAAAREVLPAAGYRPYEISNFARPGFESSHNRNYWRAGAYLGIGAGAHSHEPRGASARRWWNERDAERYVARAVADGAAIGGEEVLDREQAASEFVFLHLRTAEGFDVAAFRARFEEAPESLFPRLEEALVEGWLERSPAGTIRLTERGIAVADAVFARALR